MDHNKNNRITDNEERTSSNGESSNPESFLDIDGLNPISQAIIDDILHSFSKKDTPINTLKNVIRELTKIIDTDKKNIEKINKKMKKEKEKEKCFIKCFKY